MGFRGDPSHMQTTVPDSWGKSVTFPACLDEDHAMLISTRSAEPSGSRPPCPLGNQRYKMAKIEWKPQYETGIPIIDEQHKRLFATLDRVQLAVGQGGSREEIGALVQTLMADTREHFRTEEAIMAQHGFPDLLSHIREHELLTEKLGELSQRFEERQDSMALLVTTFMGGWLRHHISEGDLSYAQFIKSGQGDSSSGDLLLALWDQGAITFL